MEPTVSSRDQPPEQVEWSWEDNKAFENALALVDHNSPYLFHNIALRVPGKTPSQVQKHYNDLVEDLQMIESGLVPLPNYNDDAAATTTTSTSTNGQKRAKYWRKKPVRWTPEEHKLFLEGLGRYGEGDWRSISRYCVITRTPTQVASHAQKYFQRLRKSSSSNSDPSN